jgi:X-X-X-Leu-X-X-Gly heptad repeat protein
MSLKTAKPYAMYADIFMGGIFMENTKAVSSFEYDQKKVDKVNLVIILVLAAIIIMQAFVKGQGKGPMVTMQTLPVIALTILVYFLRIKRFIKSLLFGLIPLAAICLVIFMNEFSLDRHYMLSITTVVIALYFNKKLLFVYGAIFNALVLLLYAIRPDHLLGEETAIPFFLSIFFMLNGQIIALYFLTKWGNAILNNAIDNNTAINELVEKLQASGRIQNKQSEYQKAEVKKLLNNLERLSEGELIYDIKLAEPDEDTKEEYELFQTIGEKLYISVDSIKGYIAEVSNVLTQVSAGDLTLSISSEYKGDFVELKSSINKIVKSFNGILSEMNVSADQVASGTKQVSDGSQEISQGATEQASSIEELTASVTQIAEQTRQNAANANKANELANEAKNGAVHGDEQMKGMQKAMTEINESSANISKIIKVIDDIAFQTNILALNAAVEAARAGVHGKGFAVVAEEVRNLAARSANAAKETTALIEGSIKKAEAGTKIADDTAAALEEIVKSVEKAVQLVGEIAVASNEQATGIAQVNKGIEQMSQVVQTNSATSEEAAAAAEELSSQAELLKAMVGKFQLKQAKVQSRPQSVAYAEPEAAPKREKSSGAPKIILNDSDFGKY